MRRAAHASGARSVSRSPTRDADAAYHPASMSTTNRRTRLPSEVFDLPIEKIRDGYYSDAYFNYTKRVLEQDGHRPRVLMQVFQRKHAVLGGMDEAIAILRECAGRDDADGALAERLGRARGARPLRRRRDRAVGDGDDDRGRLLRSSATSRRRSSAASRAAP